MNTFQTCKNTSDCVPLYLPQQLFLKPIAKLNITVQVPQKRLSGQAISNWEIMDKLRKMIKPDEFSLLKATNTSMENICFEAELELRSRIEKVVVKLNDKFIKLIDIKEPMRVEAKEAKLDFPSRHSWDAYFRDAVDMNENKPGERPDTIHLSHLPTKWFVPFHLSGDNEARPSEKIFYRVFEKFGSIRNVDIPVCDAYRPKMKAYMTGMQSHAYDEYELFEGYIQFKEYGSFAKVMDTLRGMKLLHKEEEGAKTAEIRVQFDKTKHLSDASIRRREIVRDRLAMKERKREESDRRKLEEQKEKEEIEKQKQLELKQEKEKRRRDREERRKAKLLEELKVNNSDELNKKIAREEKKLLKAKKKLQALRLVEELFKRIQIKYETEQPSTSKGHTSSCEGQVSVSKLKELSEADFKNKQDNLHKSIEGKAILKSLLTEKTDKRSDTESELELSEEDTKDKAGNSNMLSPIANQNHWFPPYYPPTGLPYNLDYFHHTYPAMGGAHFSQDYPRGRGYSYRGRNGGPSRGFSKRGYRGRFNPQFRGRGRGAASYPPDLQHEYMRYFQKFLDKDDQSRSRSRSRSHSRHRTNFRRSRSRSRNSSCSRSRSRRSYSRNRYYSRSRRSSSRSRSRSHSSRSSRPNLRKRTSSQSSTKSIENKKHLSRSERESKETRRSGTPDSVDSSKFISPSQFRHRRSKS